MENLNLQTGLRSNGGSVPEKSRFSNSGGPRRPSSVPERVKLKKNGRQLLHRFLVFCLSFFQIPLQNDRTRMTLLLLDINLYIIKNTKF